MKEPGFACTVLQGNGAITESQMGSQAKLSPICRPASQPAQEKHPMYYRNRAAESELPKAVGVQITSGAPDAGHGSAGIVPSLRDFRLA